MNYSKKNSRRYLYTTNDILYFDVDIRLDSIKNSTTTQKALHPLAAAKLPIEVQQCISLY